jgi:hypothetical protein
LGARAAKIVENNGDKAMAIRIREYTEFLNTFLWQAFIPFVKGVGNIAEKGLELTPIYGAAKAMGYGAAGLIQKAKGNQEYEDRLVGRAGEYAFGVGIGIALLAMSGLFDDDDEEGTELYGKGTGDYRKDKVIGKVRPKDTLRTSGGHNIALNYLGTPGIALKMNAAWGDINKWSKEELSDMAKLWLYATAATGVVNDTYFSSIRDIANTDPETYWTRKGAELATRAAIPYVQTSRQLEQLRDPEAKKAIGFIANLAKYSGLLAGWSVDKPALDYRGKSYDIGKLYTSTPDGFVKMFVPADKPDAVDNLVIKYHPIIMDIRRNEEKYLVPDGDGSFEPMSDEQYYKYNQYKGDYLNRALEAYIIGKPEEKTYPVREMTESYREHLRKESIKQGRDERDIAQEEAKPYAIKKAISEIETASDNAAFQKMYQEEYPGEPLPFTAQDKILEYEMLLKSLDVQKNIQKFKAAKGYAPKTQSELNRFLEENK